MRDLAAELAALRAQHLYRARRVVSSPQGPRLRVDGRELLAFCSNDYLGLAADPRVQAALVAGAARWGSGGGAAHLVCGHSAEHHALEEELAEFTGRPRALLFSTGYMANLGVITALAGRGDTVLQDRLNHASLLDGGLLSGARFARYAHADAGAAAARLATAGGERVLVTDGVFSMDGDLAPLPALAAACRAHGAWLVVDDAHGFGVLGREGRGSAEHFGLGVADVPVLIGTLGKAFGTSGAFVAGSEDLIEYLIQKARTYIFTTATPPAVAAATRAALAILRREDERRARLGALIAQFRAGCGQLGLTLMPSATPIQPVVVGSAERALAWSAALRERGLLVAAIRPPTVPAGSARLRVTLSAAHTEAEVARLLDALAAIAAAEVPA
ncbi:8-amino-7-oxononanoate synthase [Plasticicumulans lactativorans]|uniref:8-amino-7-oxononanoate synthase n=1 Tax=Plasticicumulans lactativorans TaxID=1133106 RepID=A0A4R2L4F2_9GAMM|nr:8-amino-7-oxononanoate synthase [Plasticicumulans lactativorans]TCO80127.1 8-amino-7-oxononanoate synthase [Plasticicumulans lactativorans]